MFSHQQNGWATRQRVRGLPSFALGAMVLFLVACGGTGPQELEISVRVIGDQLEPGTIQVGQGDTVTLKIQPDRAGEIHVHGYDLQKALVAGEVAQMVFVAEATGRFLITFHEAAQTDSHGHGEGPVDAHGHDEEGVEVDVGFLEVRP